MGRDNSIGSLDKRARGLDGDLTCLAVGFYRSLVGDAAAGADIDLTALGAVGADAAGVDHLIGRHTDRASLACYCAILRGLGDHAGIDRASVLHHAGLELD